MVASDPHAFASLYIRHRSSFTSHARRYLRDPRDADDVVQEAFLRLFLALPELETELQALAYARRTITNLCIDRYRADARRPRLVALEGAPVDDLAEDDTGDPVVRAEDAALVRDALSQLPALYREALVKREIEEKPLPVIADELDVAEDSVKHLLFRARRGLRKLLAGTSVAPGADIELTRGLRPAARGASGGVAGLLVLALIGLGSGPDLRAVPVVGVDLPDVLGVTAVAEAVGDAVRGAVRVIVPGAEVDAAAGQDRTSRPVARSQGVPGTGAPAVAGESGTEPAADGALPGASIVTPTVGAGRSGVPVRRQPTTVATVVDGVQVVTVLPPTVPLHEGGMPVPGVRPVLPGSTTGRAPVQGVVPPLLLPGRDVPMAAPVGPVVRPGSSSTPGRSPRADDAAQVGGVLTGGGVAAERAAERAERTAEKAADKAAAAAEKAQDRSDKAVEKAAEKVDATQQKVGAKAEQAAQKAADKADAATQKAADGAAEKAAGKAAEKAAERAAAERAAAARAAERAAELAAAQAAERAAAAAAAQAAERAAAAAAAQAPERAAAAAAAAALAEQAAAAAAPVSAVVTPVAPALAP